jgi:antitoxin component of RelBE/YafQ-DinJ toxin-antitoxin module
MDAKITLSFDARVIEKAKRYAESQNMSLSRLMELLLDKITSKQYPSLEDLPLADWVSQVAEGPAEYQTRPKKRAKLKEEYRTRKK